MQLDRTDLQLLHILANDGRISFTELSERICLSQTPTLKRVRRLEKQGFISGYKAVLNEGQLGGKLTVFTQVSLVNQKRQTLQTFEDFLTKAPEVVDGYLMSGKSDYMLRIVVDTMSEFETFLTEGIARITEVNSLISNFALRPVVQKAVPPKLVRSLGAP